MNYRCFVFRNIIILAEVLLHIVRLANDMIKAPVIFFYQAIVQPGHRCSLAVDTYNARFPCNEFYAFSKPVPENTKIYIEVIGSRKNNVGLIFFHDSFNGMQ